MRLSSGVNAARRALVVCALLVLPQMAGVAHADSYEVIWQRSASTAAHSVEAFWTRTAPVYGMRYAPANLRLLQADVPTVSACDAPGEVTEDHAYCPADTTVYVDLDSGDDHSVASLLDDDRPYIVAAIMAHEFGHHVQNLLGVLDRPNLRTIDVELQADCLAGLYLGSSPFRHEVVDNLDDLVAFSVESADPAGTRASDPDAHGSGAMRAAAILRGFTSDPTARACDL